MATNHDQDVSLLLWLDLETTGGSEQDVPIEVGAVITEADGSPVGNPFHNFIAIPVGFHPGFILPEVRKMHEESGLWRDLVIATNEHHPIDDEGEVPIDSPIHLPNVDDRMAWWIMDTVNHYDEQTDGVLDTLNVRLSGSGVSHFDSRFIKKFFPYTWGQIKGFDNITKPTADLGVLRRLLQLWSLDDLVAPVEFPRFASAENLLRPHRALDDVFLFIEQYKWYRQMFQELRDLHPRFNAYHDVTLSRILNED